MYAAVARDSYKPVEQAVKKPVETAVAKDAS
jgi:hypothetical protein